MKFEIDCRDLKKAADKVMTVVPKKTALYVMEHMKIATSYNSIIISATNSEQFVNIRVPATIIEPGETFVSKDNIKKVYNLTEYVTISVDNGKFNIKGSKKKSAVPAMAYKKDDLLTFPMMDSKEKFMDIKSQKLVQTLGSLSCFLFKDNESNKVMAGYSFDGDGKRIVAIDGHRIGLRRMDNCFVTDKKVVVPGAVYPQLKKIATDKESNTEVFMTDKYIQFIGTDFELFSRLIEGEYFNVDQMLNECTDYELYVNPSDLGKLAKEYNAIVKSTKSPMYFTYNKELNLIRTGVSISDYITVDEVEIVNEKQAIGLSKDFMYGFDPLFIQEAMQLYDDEVKCSGAIKTRGNNVIITPIKFDNGDYLSLVLPVNITGDTADKFLEYLNAA